MKGGSRGSPVLQNLHFISGLPRSGVGLLSAILRQNPRFLADTGSPGAMVFDAAARSLAAAGASAEQQDSVLRAVLEGCHAPADPPPVVFDANFLWPSQLSRLRRLYPTAKLICCVRNPAWTLDSLERGYRSGVFASDGATVYARADALAALAGDIGRAWAGIKEAYYGADAAHMLLIDYDILAQRPRECLDLIYSFIGERLYAHDFENVRHGGRTARIEFKPRETILPPDVFQRFEQMTFWRNPSLSRAFSIVPQQA
jgi:sulfotransferase